MIGTLLSVHSINLRRDRVGQLMRFLLPIAFFTVFALVFGGAGRTGTRAIPVLVVAGDDGNATTRVMRALSAEGGLRVRTTARRTPDGPDTTRVPLDRARAEAMVRAGDAPVAILLPARLDSSLASPEGAPATVELLSDPSNPFATEMVGGLLQKVVMTALPDAMLHRGAVAFDRFGGGLTEAQRTAVARWTSDLRNADAPTGSAAAASMASPIEVVTRKVVGENRDGDMIAFYAAGIAVMFLLFSSTAAAGTLLAEIESGTLDRLLTSGLGMGRLLAGKWLYIALAGALQIAVMFVYAVLAFRLDLAGHLSGFLVMTAVTAAAAAAFGVLLATLCRTREQLSGISTLVVLMFSAFGGSMFPRFLMSEGMQRMGLFAFNAWALDGYVKVFWRDAPLPALAPQVGALIGFTVVFMIAARLLARRWESA